MMDPLDITLVEELRSMARERARPSELLHTIIARTGNADRILLVRYLAAVFRFTEGQAYPIFGWLPDEQGELKDADIDRILTRRMEQTRTECDRTIETLTGNGLQSGQG